MSFIVPVETFLHRNKLTVLNSLIGKKRMALGDYSDQEMINFVISIFLNVGKLLVQLWQNFLAFKGTSNYCGRLVFENC